MTDEAPYEHVFVTVDGGKTFKVIEDEWGDIFWAYHHVPPHEFIEEVNRWLTHVGVEEERLLDRQIDGPSVKHLWAKMKNEEQFDIVEWEDDEEVFPVTRVML